MRLASHIYSLQKPAGCSAVFVVYFICTQPLNCKDLLVSLTHTHAIRFLNMHLVFCVFIPLKHGRRCRRGGEHFYFGTAPTHCGLFTQGTCTMQSMVDMCHGPGQGSCLIPNVFLFSPVPRVSSVCLSFSFSCVCAWAWCSTLCLSLIESLNALARHLFINLQHRKTPGSPVTRWRLFGYHRSSNDKASFTVMRSSLFPGVYSLGNLAFPLCPGATSHTSCLPACTLLCPGLLGLPCSSQKGCSTLMPPTWT